MKKLLTITLMLCILLSAGCSSNDKSSMKKTLEKSISEIKEKDYKNIGDVLSDNAKIVTSIKFSSKATKKISEINKDLTLKVNSIEIKDEEAIANVTVNSGNLTKAILNSLDKSMLYSLGNPLSGKSSSDMFNEQFIKELDVIKTTEKTGDITFKKVRDVWVYKDNKELQHLIIGEL